MQRGASVRRVPAGALAVGGLAVVAAYAVALATTMQHGTYDEWGGLLVAPALIALSFPILRREARREGDERLLGLLMIALLLKLGASLAREYVAFGVYGGQADATDYQNWGVHLAPLFRAGSFHVALTPSSAGTDFIRILTGLIYAITGPSKFAGYLIFSWIGFWGLFCFYRAFVVAVPGGRRRSYAVLVFLLPSMLFWPSGIGKEAWMLFILGVASLGGAYLMTGAVARGTILAGLGTLGALAVRPHMAGLFVVALAAAFLIKRPSRELGPMAPLAKAVGLCVVTVLALVLVSQADRFLNESGITTSTGLNTAFQQVTARTVEGGSGFTPSPVTSPLRLPMAAFTVLFRPLVIEAHNTQELLAALEGTFLLILSLARWRWIAAAVRGVRRQPYVAFASIYTLLFIVAYSSFANFGLLVRERSQLYPLFFVLLSVPSARWLDRNEEASSVPEQVAT